MPKPYRRRDTEPMDAADISRRINAERLLLVAWLRAVLLQLAHPLIAAGVAEHSTFRSSRAAAFARLHQTVGAMLALTFGERGQARRAADRINAIHDRVNGRLPRAEGPFAAGTPYSACDPALLGWVHATVVDSFLLAYERYVRRLSPAERDQYCAESALTESLLRIPAGALPRTASALESYVTCRLESGEIFVTDTARALVRGVLYPPMSAPAWPALAAMRLATVGLLPSALREAYGFSWSPGRAAAFGASTIAIRGLLPLVPPMLRQWPAARAAMRQAAEYNSPR